MAGARLPGAVPSTAHLNCPAPELGQWQRGARCRARATGQQSARDRRVAKNEVTWARRWVVVHNPGGATTASGELSTLFVSLF